jgi:DNA methylase/ParB-like nuclease domain
MAQNKSAKAAAAAKRSTLSGGADIVARLELEAKSAAAVWVPLEKLTLWAANPRDNQASIPRVKALIAKYGFGAPLVARLANGEIIAGHTRYKAAHELGLKRVPVRYLDLSERDAHVLAVADNRQTELTPWADSLGKVLSDYSLEEVELAGWDQDDLDKMAAELLREDGELEEDEVPEPPTKPVTQLGDVWLLGRHRLVCGDSTQDSTVRLALAGAKPFIMVTDPPYGVEYDPEWRKEAGINKSQRMGIVENDHSATWRATYERFGGAVAYVWCSSLHSPIVSADLAAVKLIRRAQIIWAKPSLVISRGHYHWQHEPCWYAVREGATAKWVGDRKQSTLWSIATKDGSETTVHSTQKPIECMARPIRNHGGKDDHVYEPFSGSGTTFAAAEQLDRTCFGSELSPAYCDVIVQRWQNLSGQKAEREVASGAAPRARRGAKSQPKTKSRSQDA